MGWAGEWGWVGLGDFGGGRFLQCCRKTQGVAVGCILMSCTGELLRNFPAGRGVRFVFS